MTQEICRTFMDHIYLEKEVEKVKLELSSKPDFTTTTAFRLFDPKQIGQMDKRDFTDTLLSFVGLSGFTQEQVSLLFSRYASIRFGFSEFCKVVVPQDI